MDVSVVVSVHRLWSVSGDDGGVGVLHHRAWYRVRRREVSEMADISSEQLLLVSDPRSASQGEWRPMFGRETRYDHFRSLAWRSSLLCSVERTGKTRTRRRRSSSTMIRRAWMTTKSICIRMRFVWTGDDDSDRGSSCFRASLRSPLDQQQRRRCAPIVSIKVKSHGHERSD